MSYTLIQNEPNDQTDGLVKVKIMMAKKKDQSERILRNNEYLSYATMTKDGARRRYWAFYEAIKQETDRIITIYFSLPGCYAECTGV